MRSDAIRRWLADAPAYPPSDADRRDIDLLGLRLPERGPGPRWRIFGGLMLTGSHTVNAVTASTPG